MVKEKKIHAIEFTVITLLWILAYTLPLLFMDDYNQNWHALHVMWVECTIIGFVFLVNRLLLMPRLFFTQKYAYYCMALSALFLLLSIFVLYFDGVNVIISLLGEGDVEVLTSYKSMYPHDMPPRGMRPPAMVPGITPPVASIIPPSIGVLIVAAIIIGLDMGIMIAARWVIAEQKQSEINRERIMTQLQNLQSQVSPHFFMNTLNNIHALVDIDSQRAKQTIIELSNLMSYLLYECSNKEEVALRRELDFIGNYVNLMRLRFSRQVKVCFSHDEDIPSVNIPPLLFLNFIENSFKYGVDYEQESVINIRFNFSDSAIEMITTNNNYSTEDRTKGLGISNSRKRLDLLYQDRYQLEINNDKKIYSVTLKIPMP
ncbi:MAG: sensor histidine kinase [Rikenellaceae bacterium]